MYVLVKNNKVLVGPSGWKHALYNHNLKKLGIIYPLKSSPDYEFPLEITEDIIIYPVQDTPTEYNQKTQYLHGPFFEFTTTHAIMTWQVKDQSLDAVKSTLKAQLADIRYNKEITGVKTLVQDIEITVDTARGSRDIFVQQLLLMPDESTVRWKFPECWLTLTKSDLGQCVFAGVNHVQSMFQWESDKIVEIDVCQTLVELDQVDISGD